MPVLTYQSIIYKYNWALSICRYTVHISFVYFSCTYDGKVCPEQAFSSHITDMGLCTTFNGDPNNRILTNKTGMC